jgi:predicted double-glycine peptidase
MRVRSLLSVLVLPAVVTLLSGCASPAQRADSAMRTDATTMALTETSTRGPNLAVPVRSILGRRFARTTRQQYDFSCGSAALATLLTYHYGMPTAEEDVLRAMFAQGDAERIRTAGFSLLDMQTYLAARGLRSNGYRLPLDRLAQAGVPAIALIDTNGYRHFVVVRGVTADRVLLADPNLGTRTMPRVRFEESWNGVLFLIMDHPEIGQAGFGLAEDWGIRPRAPGEIVRDAMALNQRGFGVPPPILYNGGVPAANWIF